MSNQHSYQPPYTLNSDILRLFADIPVESLVHEYQEDYYRALQSSTDKADSAPFVVFMLRIILDAVTSSTPQVAPQVTPQVGELLSVIRGEMSREGAANRSGPLGPQIVPPPLPQTGPRIWPD